MGTSSSFDFNHYDIPVITYDYQKTLPLEFSDEFFLVSREFTNAILNSLREAFLDTNRTIDSIIWFESFSAGRKDFEQFDNTYEFKTGNRQGAGIMLAHAPQSFNYKYRISHSNEGILRNIYELIIRKLRKFTLNERLVLIEKDSEYNRQLYNLHAFPASKRVIDEQIMRMSSRHKDEISFDFQFLDSKFEVVSDPIEKDVYIFYGHEVCLVISPAWSRCIPDDVKYNYNLTRYNSFELRKGFAELLVKILNNR